MSILKSCLVLNPARTNDQLRVPAPDESHGESAEDRYGHENAEPAHETTFDHHCGHEERKRYVNMREYALHPDPLRFFRHEPREHEIETPPRQVNQITRRDNAALLRVDLAKATVKVDA